MKVQLKNEMTVTTRGGYSIKYECNEPVDLKRDKENNLLIRDCDDNTVKVDDPEIFESVMNNVRYGEQVCGRAKVSLRKVCEEADPELIADFMAATDQVPNISAEDNAEEKKDSEAGGLDDVEIEVPVTVTKDVSINDKIDVLTEEAFEDIAPETLKDFEVTSVELVDDAPSFTKDQSTSEDAEDIDENDEKNNPDVPTPGEKPKGEGEEFYEAVVDVAQMKEEVELVINPDGGISISAGGEGAMKEDEDYIEPELGAAGVDAPVDNTSADEPVITEEDDKSGEESPVVNKDDKGEDDAMDKALDEPKDECSKK